MKRLTKAEEQLMQILWDLEEGTVRDLLAHFPEPKPAYNTISTVLRVLEGKEIVNHKTSGNTHVFFPLVKKEDYSSMQFSKLLEDYFSGSISKMISFFAQKKNLSITEIDEIMKEIKKELE